MDALYLFLSTYTLVLALGLQSQFVNNGYYVGAFCNSFVIGVGNLILLKVAPDTGPLGMVAFLSGGPLGIVSSMWIYRRIDRTKAKSETRSTRPQGATA